MRLVRNVFLSIIVLAVALPQAPGAADNTGAE